MVTFASPLGCVGCVTSVAVFLNGGVVAFQPSATSEVFSAWHFLIFVLVGRVAVQKRAGDERADVLAAELPVVGALLEQPGCPPLTWSWADACHDTQHVFILSF